MEEMPEIIMRCPKCAGEFSPDTAYCETCSVMLEPVEIGSHESWSESDRQNPSVPANTHEDDKILDDVKIDSLKTDIEQTFVRTLLLELGQLRSRSFPGDNPLSGNETADLRLESGEGSREDEIIGRRITKLEAILGNLEKKIETDISDIETRLEGIRKPGFFTLLTADGRIYRMLTSELKAKYAALDSIRNENPSLSPERFFKPSSVTMIATAVIVAAGTWAVFSLSAKKGTIPRHLPAALPIHTDAVEAVSRQDVTNLLEDIKKASLNKDLILWEASYSKNYAALKEKKENIKKLWRNYDYRSLEYRIDRLDIRPEAASALITWDIELRAKKTGKIIRGSELLSADFIMEDKTLKISAIRKNRRR